MSTFYKSCCQSRDMSTTPEYGPEPFIVNIGDAARENTFFHTVLWTGVNLQLVVICINPGGETNTVNHPGVDQFLVAVEGECLIKFGTVSENPDFQETIHEGYAVCIPAGRYHNIINTGDKQLKLYSIYAPSQHPWGTFHNVMPTAETLNKSCLMP